MRVSREEKAKSHDRIVASAARRLREAGSEAMSVADVMRDAGLTHGGFYRHFPDKDALVAAAVAQAFDSFTAPLAARVAAGDAAAGVAAYIATYLSDGHVAHPERGCPAAASGTDIARADTAARDAFAAGVEAVITAIAAGLKGPNRRARAARQFAMMVGTVMLARAGNAAMAEWLLAAARQATMARD